MPSTTTKVGFSFNYLLGENGWKPGYDENWQQLDAVVISTYGWNRVTTIGLNYGWYGGYTSQNGSITSVAPGIIAITNNATRYVERDIYGTVYATTGSFTAGRKPMAVVTSSVGSITNVVDARISDVDINFEYNVKRYGAKCDNVTDDTVAVRAAIAAMPATGGKLVFPSGKCKITGGLTVPNTGNVTIEGEGWGSEIVATFSVVGLAQFDYVFLVSGVNVGNQIPNVTISNLKISGAHCGIVGIQYANNILLNHIQGSGAVNPNATGKISCILGQYCSDVTIIDCDLSGNGQAGVTDGDYDIQFINGYPTNIKIFRTKCVTTLCNVNIGLFSCYKCTVEYCEVSGARESGVSAGRMGYGIMMYQQSTEQDDTKFGRCHINFNNVHDVRGIGIYNQSIHRTSHIGNICENNGAGMLDGSLICADYTIEGDYQKVIGNHSYSANKNGIAVSSSRFSHFAHNVVRDPGKNGIAVYGSGTGIWIDGSMNSTDVTLFDNTVIGCTTGNGIGQPAGSTATNPNIRIKNNHVSNPRTASTCVGISTENTATQWSFSDNDVSGYVATFDYRIKGTGLHVFDDNNSSDKIPYRSIAVVGDVNVTLTNAIGISRFITSFETTLTANRTVFLPAGTAADPVFNGQKYRVEHKATNNGNFTVNFGGVVTLKQNTWGEVTYSNGGSRCTGYGELTQENSQLTPTEAVLVSGVDVSGGNSIKVTLTAARVVGAPINPFTGQRLVFTFVQNGIGGWAITWNAVFKHGWVDTGNTLNKRSSIAFIYDGTNWNQDSAQALYV